MILSVPSDIWECTWTGYGRFIVHSETFFPCNIWPCTFIFIDGSEKVPDRRFMLCDDNNLSKKKKCEREGSEFRVEGN